MPAHLFLQIISFNVFGVWGFENNRKRPATRTAFEHDRPIRTSEGPPPQPAVEYHRRVLIELRHGLRMTFFFGSPDIRGPEVRTTPTRKIQNCHVQRTRYRVVLRGTILNRTYDAHKNLYISIFLRIIFGPIYYTPP